MVQNKGKVSYSDLTESNKLYIPIFLAKQVISKGETGLYIFLSDARYELWVPPAGRLQVLFMNNVSISIKHQLLVNGGVGQLLCADSHGIATITTTERKWEK